MTTPGKVKRDIAYLMSWTVVIVPHGSDASRHVHVSTRALRAVKWGACVIAAGVVVVAVGIGVHMGKGNATAVTTLERNVAVLQDTVASLTKKDDQLRLLAGLPAAEPDSVAPFATVGIDGLIRHANDLSASFAEVSARLSKNVERLASTPSIMPTTGWLSSEFSRSRFHPILHKARPHEGIDLAAPYGTPVVAPAAGVVERITEQTGYGLVLEIDHGNGVETKYAHLSRVVARVGQRVTRGQAIAAIGNSGLSTGPHLHYEVHVNGKVVDPLTYVLPGAIPD